MEKFLERHFGKLLEKIDGYVDLKILDKIGYWRLYLWPVGFFAFTVPLVITFQSIAEVMEGDQDGWSRLGKVAIFVGLAYLLFGYGKRGFLKGNLTSMRLARLGPDGKPAGREVPVTRQDMDTLVKLLAGPPRILGLRPFTQGEYVLLVDKDYRRKYEIYLGAKDRGSLRAARRLWSWGLTAEEEARLYALLPKYIDRLGQR